MAPASIPFANFGEIYNRGAWGPGIRAHRNFNAKAAFAQADAVDRLRVQVIRYEFVIALEVVISDIKEERVVAGLNPFPQDVD